MSPDENFRGHILAQKQRPNTLSQSFRAFRELLVYIITVVLVSSFFVTPVQAENPVLRQDNSVSSEPLAGIKINSLFTDQHKTLKITIVASEYKPPKPKPKPVIKPLQNQYVTVNSGINYGGNIKIIGGWSYAYINCYSWVKSQRYIPRTRNGNAGSTPTNLTYPVIGAAAVMYGHIALVIGYTNTTVTVKEANFRYGYLDIRTIPRSVIYGYWN